MILVFVSGPYSAPDRAGVEANVARCAKLAADVARLGAMPVVPNVMLADPVFSDVQSYEFWIEATCELLNRCEAVIFTDDYLRSSGARREEQIAKDRGIIRLYSVEELRCLMMGKPAR